jgi:outer membrane protein TolC
MTVVFTLLALVAQPDTLDLATLRAAAEAQDPRAVQPELYVRAAALRIEAIGAEALPQLALTGQATAQSDVPSIPLGLPDGSAPAPPLEQARVQVEADWPVYDGGRRARRADLERARLAEQTAGVAVSLYPLREATTEAFFGALLAQTQARTLALAEDDLEARLALLRTQAVEGAALDADVDAVEAERLRVRQRVAEAEARRRAALDVLSGLTGLALGPDATLALPDLAADAGLDLAAALAAGSRPEFARFAATADRAEAEARLAASAPRPTVSVFGQAGVGRPSPLEFLSDDLAEYALVGVRVRWAPVDWGRSRREAAAARIQADAARAEAEALARQLARDVADDRAEIDRLRAALALDDEIVALRENALHVAARQLDEGVLLPDVYTDRLTDLAEARLARDRHRVELARAQARLLSALGLFPDAPLDR